MSQSRTLSLVEAGANVVVGYGVALAAGLDGAGDARLALQVPVEEASG